jgi:integrase/recombinase XerD
MGNKNKLPEAFDPDQLVQLFDVIDNVKVGVASALAFFCGLRISEVCNLKMEDINLHTKKLKVVNSKYTLRGKTGYGKDRYVEIPDQMISPLKKWFNLIQGGKWLLPSDRSPDDPLRKKSLYEQYRVYLRRAGMEIKLDDIHYTARINGKKVDRTVTRHKYNFHTLRHSYGTYLRNKGVPLEDIKDFMGHERFDTTLVYAKLASHRKREIINSAFNSQLRQQVIPQEEVKRIAHPQTGQSPVNFLQMQMLRNEITEEEFQRKKQLLQMNDNKLLVGNVR